MPSATRTELACLQDSNPAFHTELEATAFKAADTITDLLAALETMRDYVSDAANGTLAYEGSGDGFKAMAAEDLVRIDAALDKAKGGAA